MGEVESTLSERGKRYGEFTGHAKLSQGLQSVMRSTDGWQRLTPEQAEALTMIQHKVARILNGDPNYRDNWHDIQGYAKLVEDELGEDVGDDVNASADRVGGPALCKAIMDLQGACDGNISKGSAAPLHGLRRRVSVI